MGFAWEALFFWFFAIGAVASSAAVVAFRNPLYSALSLVVDFFFFAALYVLLSAHMMAITQVLVYAGAIMVLFLFIIMLLNLKDSELGEFEFRVHHVISLATVGGLFFFMFSAITPLVKTDDVTKGREDVATKVEAQQKLYEEAVKAAEEATDPEEQATLEAAAEQARPNPIVQTRTAVKGPLYADLNEQGLDKAWADKIEAYDSGRTDPSQGKWERFEKDRPVVVPPALTGKELRTERGYIRSGEPAGFGTIEPMSILIVNRFVVPFELTALLLLAAIVGAVIIAKRRL